MFESCHSHYQYHSRISLLLLESGQDKHAQRDLLHIKVCNSHVSADMNGNWHSHYIVRQWRLTGAVLRRGWDPQGRPFAPKHKQNEIKRRRKADKTVSRQRMKRKEEALIVFSAQKRCRCKEICSKNAVILMTVILLDK